MVSGVFVFLLLLLLQSAASQQPSTKLFNSSWMGQPLDCSKTNWMHTAKTGSTFCLAIQHACCKDQFEAITDGIDTLTLTYALGSPKNRSLAPFHYISHYCYRFERHGYPPLDCKFAGRPEHLPLHKTLDLDDKMGMAIVRDPKSRVISALLDGVHIEGFIDRTFYYEMKTNFTEIDKNSNLTILEKAIRKAQTYIYYPHLYGHQVKMLLGDFTLDLSRKTDELYPHIVDVAVERLRKFFFVGIFEQYTRALQLFHIMANKGTVPSAVELFPQRSTSHDIAEFVKAQLHYDDPYDSLLYERALQIFEDEITYVKERWGISV